ncbi:MAG: response regulator transcription factor [Candidatus Acidiferrales bacterium]
MSFHGGALQIQVTLSIPIEIRAKDVEVDLLTRREANLTVAQNRVLDLIMTGLENTEIANELHVTTRTAKFHVSNVLGKMGCANRTELVRAMATRQGEKECGNGS